MAIGNRHDLSSLATLRLFVLPILEPLFWLGQIQPTINHSSPPSIMPDARSPFPQFVRVHKVQDAVLRDTCSNGGSQGVVHETKLQRIVRICS